MLLATINEYQEIVEKCKQFNVQLTVDAERSGGDKYADILALSYRQAIAAHKLVADENGDVLFLSKENFSNGCLATVDVSYPSIPLFLLKNPELVKGMLRPIFRYASSDEWPFDFAPHDVGRYPIANGQAYGMAIERQMPIEECGNMLIMTAAVCLAEGNADFAAEHWNSLTQWVEYLKQNGMDPGNQLCTDDFGGHLAHNANLSIKAIIGIASYGLLSRMLENEEACQEHLETAKQMADRWESLAEENDHYRLAFNQPETWSLKYNLVWDELFGLNIFDSQIKKKEVAYYLRKRNQYGTPLDNRKTYTKADWLIWVAALADNKEDFEQMVHPLWDFLHESSSRVPFTDWYYTIDGNVAGFRNRSVVGGLFIKLLADRVNNGEWDALNKDSN
ncbi:glutaminase domain-containing protein [Gracilibacillus sp. D59]|uniref:glutaminase domain-containing protein n=1 Tax=Gracilibacillus sp. D59 TaxID=3457434 RepID=UPI003FCC7758